MHLSFTLLLTTLLATSTAALPTIDVLPEHPTQAVIHGASSTDSAQFTTCGAAGAEVPANSVEHCYTQLADLCCSKKGNVVHRMKCVCE